MSIRINTRFGKIPSSQDMNEKIDVLYGDNAVISGFDVSKSSDTSISITPGKAIVCGASIEEDRDTTTINIDSNLLTKKDLFVVIQYIHDSKQARFKVVELIEANMVVLAKLTMLNSTISEIVCAEKTVQLKELSSIAKDLETNLLDTQLLSVTGDEIKLQNSCPGKTANIKVKGKTKQNLVKTPNKEVLISGEMAIDEKCSHQINDSKAGCVDVSINGRTLQNLAGWRVGLSGGATYENGKGVMSSESVGSNIKISNNLIKSNSVYTVFMNVLKNTTVGESVKIEILGGSMAGKEYANVPDGAIGRIRMIVNGLENINHKTYTNIWKRPDYPGEFEFDSFMILEGDWIDIPLEEIPYVEGIAGVGDKSKNLVNISMVKGSIVNTSGTFDPLVTGCVRSNGYIDVKPNTTYTLSNNMDYSNYIYEYTEDLTFIKYTASRTTNTITTSETTKKIAFRSTSTEAQNDTSVKYQLEEGAVVTPYEEYYDGYKVEVKSTGKNLYNHKNLERKMIANSTIGVTNKFVVSPKRITCMDPLPAKNLSLIVSTNSDKYQAFILGVSTDNKVNATSYWSNFVRLNALEGYVYISFRKADDTDITDEEFEEIKNLHIQLEEGTTPTPYEPYQKSTVSYILEEPLIRLPNGVCDEITTDGELIRRVGKVILDGSEDEIWGINNSSDTHHSFICEIHDSKYSNHTICSVLPSNGDTRNVNSVFTSSSNRVVFVISINEIGDKTTENIRSWALAKKPIVYYELKTPIITPLDMQVVLPNGVQDKVCDDGVERRIKKIILNGSEDWAFNSTFSRGDYVACYVFLAGKKTGQFNMCSNRFKNQLLLDDKAAIREGLLGEGDTRAAYISIAKSKLSTPDLAGFKKWLSENPTIVWYELAIPYKEPYEYNKPRLSTYAEMTHVSSDTKVMPKIKVDSKGEKYPALLKPGTKYTVSVASTDGDANLDLDLGGVKVTIPRAQYRAEITTPETLTHNNLYVAGWNTKIRDVMILQGSDSNDYVNSITSTGELQANGKYKVEVKSCGKNLFCLSEKNANRCFVNRKDNSFDIDLGITSILDKTLCDRPMKSKTSYTLKYTVEQNNETFRPRICFRYQDGSITGLFPPAEIGTFNIEIQSNKAKTIKDIYLAWGTQANRGYAKFSNIQIEESSASTHFEPYKGRTASIYLDEPLRSLPNGVCDEIVDGKLVRRVGKTTLNGSEDFSYSIHTSGSNFTRFRIPVIGSKNSNSSATMINDIVGMCDKFAIIRQCPPPGTESDMECVYSSVSLRENIPVGYMSLPNIKASTLDGFKKWLSLNPVTIYYELETPVVTDITEDLNVRTYEDVTYISTVGPVKADLEFKTPMNLRAIINQTADRITEAEKIVDMLLLPSIVQTDYERTLLEFNYEMDKFLLEGDE